MNQSNYPNPGDATVSIIPKSIKIYSDNPIHDAIDRIIDSCACIDEGDDRCHMASLELREAAEDLLILACDRIAKIKLKSEKPTNEQKHNQS